MLPVNGNVNAMPRKLSCKLEIGNNTITEVKQLTYTQDWSGNITVGQVVSSYISATIPTPSFSIVGANVTLSMGIGSPVEWVKIGVFTVSEESVRSRQGYTSFNAYDKLYNSINTYHSALTFPTTLQAVCNEVCSQIGITSLTLPGSLTLQENILDGYTLRDVIAFIAAYNGKNAYLSPNNKLELRWFSDSGYTADGTRANVPYIGENNCSPTRWICQTADGVLTSGNGEGLYLTCPFMTQSRLTSLRVARPITYRKADVDIPYGNFCLQSGDIITVTTTGSSLTVPIMANSWTYDGGLSSSVGAYGVSDYSGTANNAERSISSQRVTNVLKEKQELVIVQGEVRRATELITGATGGYIKLEFGGNGKTAQLLVMDQPRIEDALNVWIFNQNGLGHQQRASTSDPFSQVNVALTREGTVVAERIAGTKISGVKFENYTSNEGQNPEILVENGEISIKRVTASGGAVTSVANIGGISFISRSAADGTDSLAIHVESGKTVTIGMLGNSEFVYYSDTSQAPSGAEKFNFFGNIRVDGNLRFNKSTGTQEETLQNLEERVADLEQRVAALEA